MNIYTYHTHTRIVCGKILLAIKSVVLIETTGLITINVITSES